MRLGPGHVSLGPIRNYEDRRHDATPQPIRLFHSLLHLYGVRQSSLAALDQDISDETGKSFLDFSTPSTPGASSSQISVLST